MLPQHLVIDQKSFDELMPHLIALNKKLILLEQSKNALSIAKTLKLNYDNKKIPLDIRIKCSRIAVDMFSATYTTFSSDKDIANDIADACGGYSYALLEFKDFEYGLIASELAYKANPKEKYVRSNLPLAYLLNNRYDEAQSFYLKFAGDEFDKDRTYGQVFVDDIADLESQGISHKDFPRIVSLLKK